MVNYFGQKCHGNSREGEILQQTALNERFMCFLKKNISTYLTQYANNNSKKIIDLKENIIDKDFLGRTHTHTPQKKNFPFI